MKDFTFSAYHKLLMTLKEKDYSFQTFHAYLLEQKKRSVILRHDVDKYPTNSLKTALLQADMGIKGTYYFRAVPCSWNENIICKIHELGHEVGYHYESLAVCHGNMERAYEDFKKNLERLRNLVPVNTICMHGSPRSPYDSRDLWNKYNYRELGIAGEPYRDIDFSDMFYLTDTGRRWDGYKVSVRDKVERYQRIWKKNGWNYHSTFDIVESVLTDKLSDRIMFTFHPQRWTDNDISWTKELILQQMKNVIKRYRIKNR
jgi:hypothetical protein